MRHAHVFIFVVVALVGVFTLLFSVPHFPQPAPLAVQYVPYGQATATPQGNTVIVQLDVGDLITSELDAIGGGVLPALRSGTVHGADVSADYTQSMKFGEAGLFSGGRIVFGEDERGQVADFLEFTDAIFKYQVDFAPGLRSEIEGGSLPDLEDEDLKIMGDSYAIVDTDVSGNRVSLRMFGGFGSIEFEDADFTDNNFHDGVQVNGQRIDARVKIRATQSGGKLTIFSIQYLLEANAAYGGPVQVLPRHCTREYLQYPLGLLSPDFDICYRGLEGEAVPARRGISGNEVKVDARGDDEYVMYAQNLHGVTYEIPLAQLPGSYGNKGRDFVFVEAGGPGAPNINLGDYFLVSSRNDVQGVSHVLRYDSVSGNTAYFEDLGTGDQKAATFNAGTGEGQLLFGEGTYEFVVGAGDALAMDQTNDGSISGDEANFVFPGGSRVDFGPGFTVRIITPRRLFDEATADEVTRFDITFGGGNVDLVVPSPQTTIPGYTFRLEDAERSVEQGLTKYGILFTLHEDSESDELELVIPGAYARSVKGGARADVYITFERDRWMKKPSPETPKPAPKCGDGIITAPEMCDPPGSLCEVFKRPGVCADDCGSCQPKPEPVCGNNLLEEGEQCESVADCPNGQVCESCQCKTIQAVCGNNLIEPGEQCEKDVDCAQGQVCSMCLCQRAPEPQQPAPQKQPNILARFFAWLAELFGA